MVTAGTTGEPAASSGGQRLRDFVQRNYLAILATVYPSGGPQALPVWYDYDGAVFSTATDAAAVKVRNIENNPQVALCITDTTRNIRSLTVRGRAEVITDNDAAQELHRRLSMRYLGDAEGEEWAESLADEEMVVLRIIPERFIWTG